MLIQFQTQNVTFFDEDKEYFIKRFKPLEKLLGNEKGDDDSVELRVHLEKGKSHSGDRFLAKLNGVSPHHGKFYAEISADTIRKCADLLKDKLKIQFLKFHDKKK